MLEFGKLRNFKLVTISWNFIHENTLKLIRNIIIIKQQLLFVTGQQNFTHSFTHGICTLYMYIQLLFHIAITELVKLYATS